MHIQLNRLTKKFEAVKALDDVSLTIEPGQVVALLGANGAGKSTLLRALAGVVSPERGEILYDSERFDRSKMHLRRRFVFLPDFPLAFPGMTILRHVGMMLRLYERPIEAAASRVAEILTEFDILPLAETQMFGLSRGEFYKASLAGLLAVEPEVWLLDEPFASGMDPHGIASLKDEARSAARRGATIFYSTQILDIAERFSDRVCVIHRGKIEHFSGVEELASVGAQGAVLETLFRQLRERDK